MPITSHERARSQASVLPKILLGLGIAFFLVIAVAGVAGVSLMKRLLTPFAAKVTVSDSTVVRSIQQLQRLETVVFKLDQVVTEERTGALPSALVGERMLLIVHGDVTAGIDMAKLRQEDVHISGRNIRVKLPPAEIFATRTDTNRTRVYSRDTGIFTSPDPQMESEVRRRAEGQLTAASLKEGVLVSAGQNARNTITSMLHSLGFERVEVE
jgi:hypothetical protein